MDTIQMKKKLFLLDLQNVEKLQMKFCFSKQTKKLLNEFINIFNDLNIEVYEPFERTKHIIQREDNWAYDLAERNFHDLKKSFFFFCFKVHQKCWF